MKIFHKNVQKISNIHEITNLEWESEIDKIYLQILSKHSSALCIATNTIKNDEKTKLDQL